MPGSRFQLSAFDIQFYRAVDVLSGVLIAAMLVFSPWAFGTTQSWSVWTMNCAGYTLGILLALKSCIRVLKGYQPARWETFPHSRPAALLMRALASSTVLILGYTLLSALNARATWLPAQLRFDYHSYISWLPHSLDSGATWLAFWQYLGLACAFWSIRDWLLGKSGAETRVQLPSSVSFSPGSPFPARLRRLLWVLAVSGGVLALEGIIQRLEGSGELLFLVKPRVNPGAEAQFGPYAYRSNASQYFNLLWPVCLGFWWTLHRAGGLRRKSHHVLLVCGALMAACPIISTSRGGALVTLGITIVGGAFLLGTHLLFPRGRTENRASRKIAALGMAAFFVTTLALGFGLGWKALRPRMAQIDAGYEQREAMYARARPMALDYPLFGTGPGTFNGVFQLYRISTDTYWPAQLHNDWLETRITFGWIGGSLLGVPLVLVLGRWFIHGGIHGGRRFVALAWISLAGCMVHARWDLPFQIHSILFLFLVICAVLSVLSRRPEAG